MTNKQRTALIAAVIAALTAAAAVIERWSADAEPPPTGKTVNVSGDSNTVIDSVNAPGGTVNIGK